MPTYTYYCDTCKKKYDLSQRMSDPHINKCKNCGNRTAKRLISKCNVITSGHKRLPPVEVENKLKPNGKIGNSPAYLLPKEHQNGLSVISRVGDALVEHKNLAGPPPACMAKDGRVVIVKNNKKK